MPDGLDDLLDNDTTGQTPSGKGLRGQLEAVLEQNRLLQEQLSTFQAQQRQAQLDGLFGKHSIPALAKDFFPKDAELTDESATAFVEKYGALWGAQAQQATTPPPAQQAAVAMQSFAAQAQPAPITPLSEADFAAKFAEATNPADVLRMVAEMNGAAFPSGM